MAWRPAGHPRAVRLNVKDSTIRFSDLIQGDIEENLEHSVGDFIIRRADGLPAYQLAVVVDDAFQGITEVVRGTDLLESTARQIHLQHALGLPTPAYAHHPLAVSATAESLGNDLVPIRSAGFPPQKSCLSPCNFWGRNRLAEWN